MPSPEIDWSHPGFLGGAAIGGALVFRSATWLVVQIIQIWRPAGINDELRALRKQLKDTEDALRKQMAESDRVAREDRRRLHEGQNGLGQRIATIEGELKRKS